MGATISKEDEDKCLVMCRERIHYIRQALDSRRSLAVTLTAYTRSLGNTGMALGRLVHTSQRLTAEKSDSQISNSECHSEEEDDDEFNDPVCPESLVRVFKNRHDPSSDPKSTATALLPATARDPKTKILESSSSSSMKEIEQLFEKASGSGKHFPNLLGFQYLPIPELTDLQAVDNTHTSKMSAFLTPFLTSRKHDDNGSVSEMESDDSHISTLDRLYAWEKKLYDEVKLCGIFIKKFNIERKHLREKNSKTKQLDINRKATLNKIDRNRAIVKDLHSRIQIAIQRIDSISNIIQEIRDNQLQPQLEELIRRSLEMWKEMFDCHKRQHDIVTMLIDDGDKGGCSMADSPQLESNCEAAAVLDYQLTCLHTSFLKWISMQRSYLQSINNWLLKCVDPIIIRQYVGPVRSPGPPTGPVRSMDRGQYSSRRRNEMRFSPVRDVAPPIYVTCRNWMEGLDNLPTMDVVDAIKGLLSVEIVNQEKKGQLNMLKKIHKGQSVNWRFDDASLQRQLGGFLNRLTAFSEKSVIMYADLGSFVDTAKNRYETWVTIPQQ